MRHTVTIRVTHWISAISTATLIVSGVAILLAHPRLYWGETGAVGTPALIDLPIPFVLGHSGWGRYLHFLAAWVSIIIGGIYVAVGLASRHFARNLWPSRADLAGPNLARVTADHLRLKPSRDPFQPSYNVLQRLTYLIIVFLVGPLVVLSGLAFSPALASVAPALVEGFGGQQSARTIHFFAGLAVVVFLIVHIAMVALTGFLTQLRAMTIGGPSGESERS
jgi:thiosulfate reductase cytochrome b subunit